MGRVNNSRRQLVLQVCDTLDHDGLSVCLAYQTVDLGVPALAEDYHLTSKD